MPRLVGRSEQARSAAAKADLSAIGLALDMYEMDMGAYPDSLQALRAKPGDASSWKGPYLKKDPKDPWGRDYVYTPSTGGTSDYSLSSMGPNGQAGDQDDVTN
jgi:general secretion pathway protein G